MILVIKPWILYAISGLYRVVWPRDPDPGPSKNYCIQQRHSKFIECKMPDGAKFPLTQYLGRV